MAPPQNKGNGKGKGRAKPKQAARARRPRKLASQFKMKKFTADPRGYHFWHHRSDGLVPTIESEGEALGVTARAILRHTMATGSSTLVFFSNTGVSNVIGVLVNLNFLTNPYTVTITQITLPTLSGTVSTVASPTSARAMKMSAGGVNTTSNLNRGGGVTTIMLRQRLLFPVAPSAMTGAQWLAVAETLNSHPNANILDAEAFSKGRVYDSMPADTTSYKNYREWQGALTVDGFFNHMAEWPTQAAVIGERPMYALGMLVEASASDQTWRFTATASFYTRWPLDTVPGTSMSVVPTAPAEVLNKHSSVARSVMDMGHSLVSVAAPRIGNAAGTLAMGVARGAARQAVGRMIAM